jgi:Ca2+-transporting ATPase
MGQRGTDVAREAAELVLLDDSFATIVTAVHEGRRIFDDIRKFIRYTMTSNSGEIWVLLLAPLLGLPLPLLPLHILWINLVTDGLPGLALSAEPAEKDVMQRRPRPPEESIFAHGMAGHILWVGLLIGGLTLATQAWTWSRDQAEWQTMVFTVLVVAQLFHCLAIRSERDSLWRIGLFSNPALVAAIIVTVLAQVAVVYLPFFNTVFRTVPLSATQFAACFAIGSIVLVAVEIEKFARRRTAN